MTTEWKLVPLDPDDGMIEAGEEITAQCREFSTRLYAADIYRAMLAASPSLEPDSDHFLVAYSSKDGKVTGIDHETNADWQDVLTAHIALRDWLNERIANQGQCPFTEPDSQPEDVAALKHEAESCVDEAKRGGYGRVARSIEALLATITHIAKERDTANAKFGAKLADLRVTEQDLTLWTAKAEAAEQALAAEKADIALIGLAISSRFGARFMDPPDGGEVEIAEQATRVCEALADREEELRKAREVLKDLHFAGKWSRDTLRRINAALHENADG